MMSQIHVDLGRLQLLSDLSSARFGLNVGCGLTRFPNKINVDVSREKSHADIVASALALPFRDGVFSECFFSEVLEHVPAGSEVKALNELYRVLKVEGKLIMSTPNKTLAAIFSDPMFPLIRHRHYSRAELRLFLQRSSWIHHCSGYSFTAGRIPFGQPTLIYTLNWLLMKKHFDFCAGLCIRAFSQECHDKGSTLFMVMQKGGSS